MSKLNCRVRGLLPLSALLLASSPALAGSWQTGVNYGGSGPTMDLFTPTKVAASPGIMVALHYCGGSAGGVHSWFESLADQYGFYIIAPDAQGNCWDASPGRSGEKAAIVQMVQYVITNKNANSTRVCAAGASSGACMTQTLLASYAEVFAAGSALAGVPVGAWPAGDTTCSMCGQNAPSKTAQQWGDIVRQADPSFSGTRPRVQLWHGTSDTTLNYPSMLDAEVAQWTNVFGVSNGTQQSGVPKSGWTRTSYGSGTVVLEVNIGQGVGHDLTGQGFWSDVVRFCGLDQSPTGTGGTGAGGAATGGRPSGGASSGGRATGGVPTGGTATGGTASGGVPSGGTASGGRATGGGVTTSGGRATGGAVTTIGGQSATTGGTSSTGGAPLGTGGASSGGTGAEPGETCNCGVVSSDRGSAAFTALLLAGLVSLLRGRRRTRADL
jgi:poly(hydroxyalkanoate) depolymerase family esterase